MQQDLALHDAFNRPVPVAGNPNNNPFWRNALALVTAGMFGRRRMQPNSWVKSIMDIKAKTSSKKGRRGGKHQTANIKNTQGGGLIQSRKLGKRGGRRKKVSKVKRLQKAVSQIRRIIPKRSSYIFRWTDTGTIVAAQNERAHGHCADLSRSSFVGAIDNGIPIYNPATNEFISRDVSLNTAWTDIRVDVKHRLQCRNNTNQPLEAWIYQFKYIEDSSSTPIQLFEAFWDNAQGAIPTVGGGVPITGSPNPMNRFPSDSKASWCKDLKMIFHQHVILNPGNTFEKYTTYKNIKYDTNYMNDHGALYLKALKCFSYYVMIQGLIAHDSTVPTLVGYADTQLDFISNLEFKVHYITDIPVKFHQEEITNLKAMPTGAVEGGVTTAAVVQDE